MRRITGCCAVCPVLGIRYIVVKSASIRRMEIVTDGRKPVMTRGGVRFDKASARKRITRTDSVLKCALALALASLVGSCAGSAGISRGATSATAVPQTSCIVARNRVLRIEIAVTAEGDTLVGGRPLREVHRAEPPTYIQSLPWFQNREAILFRRNRYTQERPPLVLDPAEIRYVGSIDGTPVFVMNFEPVADVPDGFMLPVRPGCIFQPYISS